MGVGEETHLQHRGLGSCPQRSRVLPSAGFISKAGLDQPLYPELGSSLAGSSQESRAPGLLGNLTEKLGVGRERRIKCNLSTERSQGVRDLD